LFAFIYSEDLGDQTYEFAPFSKLIVSCLVFIRGYRSLFLIACGFDNWQHSHPGWSDQPAVSAASSGGCSNAYFPVSVGTNWAYSSTGSTLGAFTYTWTVTDLGNGGLAPTINTARRHCRDKMELSEWQPGRFGCRIDQPQRDKLILYIQDDQHFHHGRWLQYPE